MRSKDYGPDVLARPRPRREPPVVAAERDLVVEEAGGGFCGAVVECDAATVTLEDRHGRRRVFPLAPGAFALDGQLVTLTRPRSPADAAGPRRSASGSVVVEGHRARVARASRIWVEGRHDAELVAAIWNHDLAVEGVVVEPLGGIDDLPAAVASFQPGPGRRLGVLVDHLVAGSKESRIAAAVERSPHVHVVGHPYVDIWQAVRPAALGIEAWPVVPRGQDWKQGVVAALGWRTDVPGAWRRIRSAVTSYADLEPALLARMEELIDFVTAGGG